MSKFRQLVEQQVKEIEDEYTRREELEDEIYYNIPLAKLIFDYGNYTSGGIMTTGGDPEEFWGMPCRTPEYKEVRDLDIDETKIPQLIEEELSKHNWELTEEDKQTIKDICTSEAFQKHMDKVYEDLENIIIDDALNGGNDDYDPDDYDY